jgi:uncharacterized protein YoxC
MTILSASDLLAQASPPDTVAVLVSSGSLATIQAVTMIILGVAILGVLVSLLLVLLQLRKVGRSLTRVARRLEKESAPVMDRARSVAENVEFVTMAVRTDVQKLTSSVSGLNERLREAATRMEDRIQDFNALVELLQKEAEDLALDTAAAVRGVRAGTRSLAGERGSLSSQEIPSLDPRPLHTLTGDEEEEG